MKRILMALSCVISPALLGQTTDIFPVASVNPDRKSINIEIENLSNFDVFCDHIATRVAYRSSQTDNNLEETIYVRNVWVPKGTTRKLDAGYDTTSRLRKLNTDASIDVVRNESVFVSGNVKCGYKEIKLRIGALKAHATGTLELKARPDGLLLATVGTEGKVKLWDGVSGNLVKELSFPRQTLNVLFSPLGDRFYIVQQDTGSISQYEAYTGEMIQEFKLGQSLTESPILSDNGRFIASSRAGTLSIIDTSNGHTIAVPRVFVPSNSYEVKKFQFSPDGSKIAFFSIGPLSVHVLDLQNFPQYTTLDKADLSKLPDANHGFLAWSPSGQALILSTRGGPGSAILQKRTYSGSGLAQVFETRSDSYMGLALPNGKVAFTGWDEVQSSERPVRVWDPVSGTIYGDNQITAWFSRKLIAIPGSQNFLVGALTDTRIYRSSDNKIVASFETDGIPTDLLKLPYGMFLYTSVSDGDAHVTSIPSVAFEAPTTSEGLPTSSQPLSPVKCPSGKRPGETSLKAWGGVYLCGPDGKDKFQGCDATQGLVWNPDAKACEFRQ